MFKRKIGNVNVASEISIKGTDHHSSLNSRLCYLHGRWLNLSQRLYLQDELPCLFILRTGMTKPNGAILRILLRVYLILCSQLVMPILQQ